MNRGPGQWVYDNAVREALVVVWETSHRICGKRLRLLSCQHLGYGQHGDRSQEGPRVCTTAKEAAAPGAPLLYDDVPRMSGSISTMATARRSPRLLPAPHVTRLELRNNRVVVNAMQPRSAVAE